MYGFTYVCVGARALLWLRLRKIDGENRDEEAYERKRRVLASNLNEKADFKNTDFKVCFASGVE